MSEEQEEPGYYAIVGIDFEGFEGEPRVEAGERIPEGLELEEEQLEQLVRDGAVRKVEAE